MSAHGKNLPSNGSYEASLKDDKVDSEKATAGVVVTADARYHFDAADLDRVQRRLKQRHVQMYACLLLA